MSTQFGMLEWLEEALEQFTEEGGKYIPIEGDDVQVENVDTISRNTVRVNLTNGHSVDFTVKRVI